MNEVRIWLDGFRFLVQDSFIWWHTTWSKAIKLWSGVGTGKPLNQPWQRWRYVRSHGTFIRQLFPLFLLLFSLFFLLLSLLPPSLPLPPPAHVWVFAGFRTVASWSSSTFQTSESLRKTWMANEISDSRRFDIFDNIYNIFHCRFFMIFILANLLPSD